VASIQEECLRGVQAAIQGLPLLLPDASTLPDARVYLREIITARNVTPPCVVVALAYLPELLEGSLNSSDYIGWPVWVGVIGAANQELDIPVDDHRLLWRQQIKDAFHYQSPAALVAAVSLTGVFSIWEPGPVLLKEAYDVNVYASPATIWVKGRKVR
jgi:hypothetical protein